MSTAVTASAPGRNIRAQAALLSSHSFTKRGHFRDIFYSRAGAKHPIPFRSAISLIPRAPFPRLTEPAPWKEAASRSTATRRERSTVSGGCHSAGPGPVRRQRHGRQEHGLELARHAGDLRVLRLVGLDQPGELQDPCKKRAGKEAPGPSAGPQLPTRRGNNPPSPSLLKP